MKVLHPTTKLTAAERSSFLPLFTALKLLTCRQDFPSIPFKALVPCYMSTCPFLDSNECSPIQTGLTKKHHNVSRVDGKKKPLALQKFFFTMLQTHAPTIVCLETSTHACTNTPPKVQTMKTVFSPKRQDI